MEAKTTVKVKALPQCHRCQGSLVLDHEQDLITGLKLSVLLCINCGWISRRDATIGYFPMRSTRRSIRRLSNSATTLSMRFCKSLLRKEVKVNGSKDDG